MTSSVAVLGTGIMGAGMARSLVKAGLDVTVWNRSADKARPLADDGAKVAADPAEAVSEAIGSKTVWVGERVGDGHRLKLALNSWVLSITAATGQAIALARDLGVDPQLFLDTIAGGGTDSPYAQLKGKAMLADDFAPAFGLAGAVKDAGLIVDALREAGDDPALMQAVQHLMSAAADAGHADEDMAAVVYAFR